LTTDQQLTRFSMGGEPPQDNGTAAAIPHYYLPSTISFTQGISMLRAHWRLSVIILLSVTVIAAVVVKFLPKSYTATTTLIVNSDNKNPLAGQLYPVDAMAAVNYVATQTELMLSPVILLPVVDRLKLTEDREFLAGVTVKDPDSRRDAVEKNLYSQMQVEQGRGGQLLYVSASAKDPVKAADIANAVTDSYMQQERRRVTDSTGERAQRYSEQLGELRAKVTAAQDKVTAFRQQNGITNLSALNTDTRDTEVQALNSLEQKLLEAQNQRRALESKEAGQQSTADEVLASAQIQQLKSTLNAQESQLAQLSSTLGAQHPKLVELRAQIAESHHALEIEMQTLSNNTSTQLTRAKELEDKYAKAVANQRAVILHLRQLQDDGAKFILELESAQTVYKQALDGYDQIIFASVPNYTNVNVISRATPPVKATKPNKLKLMLLAALIGVVLAVALPSGFELLFNRRLRCRDDIERSFGIPVLAEFDDAASLQRIAA
jgi:polysaccharide biosynthesis transport protein